MSSNWVSAMDWLAAGGIVDIDYPAYLLDKEPRYVGNPKMTDLPLTDISLLPEGTKMKGQPKSDGFGEENLVQNPKWKKWAMAGVLIAAVIGIVLGVKGKLKLPTMKGIKDFGKTVFNYIKKPFVWVAGKFKK